MQSTRYLPKKCLHCSQFMDYELQISRGHAIVLIKIWNFTQEKKLNAVNFRKELEAKKIITSNDTGNASQLRHWGLIVPLEETGNYAITAKGIDFLKNNLEIPKKVIVNKGMGEFDFGGYYQPEITTTFQKLLKKDNPYWEGEFIHYGKIINA